VRIVAAILLVSLALAALVVLLAPNQVARSTAYDQYVCTSCGVKKVEDIRKLGPLTYHRRVTFEESALSRALKAKDCQHSWLLYRYGHSAKRPFGGGFFADGGCPSMNLQTALGDDLLSQELAHMENPSKTWGSFVAALNSSRTFDESFASWWADSDRGSFAAWAATNGFWTPNRTR
jgi:hypothetical protein